jgi:hypothetical protein
MFNYIYIYIFKINITKNCIIMISHINCHYIHTIPTCSEVQSQSNIPVLAGSMACCAVRHFSSHMGSYSIFSCHALTEIKHAGSNHLCRKYFCKIFSLFQSTFSHLRSKRKTTNHNIDSFHCQWWFCVPKMEFKNMKTDQPH